MMNSRPLLKNKALIFSLAFAFLYSTFTFAAPYVVSDQTLNPTCAPGSADCYVSLMIGRGGGDISSNLAVGDTALVSNTTGSQNSALGYNALTLNTTGANNTAIGYLSLAANTTGGYNSAFGNNVLKVNTTGANNAAFGSWAMYSNTTGTGNSIFGAGLGDNTTGNYNTGLGLQALALNTTASNNIGIGYNALFQNKTGDNNIAIGNNTGYPGAWSDLAPQNNIFIGYQAANNITSGATNNIVIGYDVDLPTTGGDNLMTIGNLIFGTGIDGTGTTASTGNVGIGIATPASRLSVSGGVSIGSGYTAVAAPTNGLAVEGDTIFGTSTYPVGFNPLVYMTKTVTENASYGQRGLYLVVDNNPTANTALRLWGIQASAATTSGNAFNYTHSADGAGLVGIDGSVYHRGSGTLAKAYGITSYPENQSTGTITTVSGLYIRSPRNIAGGAITNSYGIYIDGHSDAGITNKYAMVTAANAGFVGISMLNPSVALDVTGDIEYTGTITDTSDSRLKENVQDMENNLQIIRSLNAKSYNMIGSTRQEYGFIAQDVQAVFPGAVSVIDPENGYLGVNYIAFIPVLADAVKDLDTSVVSIQNIDTNSSFVSNLKNWLASAENGITELFAAKVKTNQLCVGEVCVDEQQFLDIVTNSNVQGSTTGGSGSVSTDGSGSTTGGSTTEGETGEEGGTTTGGEGESGTSGSDTGE